MYLHEYFLSSCRDRSVFLLFIASAIVYGATDLSTPNGSTDSIITLDKIVVTASRTKRLTSETPASVSIITKKTIQASPAKTIEDLLLTQTGVQVRRAVSIGEGIPSDIIIRGIPGSLAASRMLVLVDGIPTNASGTPFLIVNEIPLEAIERIEIVRGPNSSLYGANAFGGVVNIITQEGYGKTQGTVLAETTYPFTVLSESLGNGSSIANSLKNSVKPSYWNGNGTVHGGNDKFGMLVSTGYRTIGNYLLRDSSIVRKRDKTLWKKAINNDYSEYRFFGKARYYCNDKTELSFHARYFNSELGFGQTKQVRPDSIDVVTEGNKILFGPQLKYSLSKDIKLFGSAFYRQVVGEFWNEGVNAADSNVQSYWKSQTNDWQVESRAAISIREAHEVTLGIELLRNNAHFGATIHPATGEILPGSYAKNAAILNGAAYVQDEIKLYERLNIVPALRMDFHSLFGSAVSPKIGVSYKVNDMLRLSSTAGRSFRAPSLAELYLPDMQVATGFFLKPNAGLMPEYLWGYDAGVELTPMRQIILKINPYYNDMTNLIVEKNVTFAEQNSVSHQNISKAWSAGLEGEVEWRPVPWTLLSTHATVQRSKDRTTDSSLDYVPDYTFGIFGRLTKDLKSFRIESEANYAYCGSRTFSDFGNPDLLLDSASATLRSPIVHLNPYQTVDLSCKLLRGSYWILAAIQNLFNEKYETSGGAISTGRFASIKIGYNF